MYHIPADCKCTVEAVYCFHIRFSEYSRACFISFLRDTKSLFSVGQILYTLLLGSVPFVVSEESAGWVERGERGMGSRVFT